MACKEGILKLASDNPIEFRDALKDAQVLKALGDIGILPKVLELHAPSPNSRKAAGLGPTRCGRNGTRFRIVTCKNCLRKLQED